MPPPQHTTEYASPVLRAASPASSVGTAYGPDQTSLSDTEAELPQLAFERKWEERLGLGLPRPEELRANLNPLLPPPNGPAEEMALYEQVMHSLRHEVHQLKENGIFEQTLLRGSQAGLEPQPRSNDLDVLLRSMMGLPDAANDPTNATITNGPWNYNGNGQ